MSYRLVGKGCTHKVTYRTRGVANAVAGNQGRNAGYKLWTYHCHSCHGYHLTSNHPGKGALTRTGPR